MTNKFLKNSINTAFATTLGLTSSVFCGQSYACDLIDKLSLPEKISIVNKIANDCELVDAAIKITDGKKFGFINQEGTILVPTVYDELYSYHNSTVLAKIDNKFGVIDIKDNNIIVPIIYDYVHFHPNGSNPFFQVKQNSKIGFFNKKGKLIIPFEYDKAGILSENMITLQKDNLLGVVDDKNTIIIPFSDYRYIYGISEGLFAVINNKYKAGYLDKQNNVIIDFKYDYVTDFSNGFAIVGLFQNPNDSIKNYNFTTTSPFSYEYYEQSQQFSNNLKFGIINKKGKLILPVEYNSEDIELIYLYNDDESNNLLFMAKNRLHGLVDLDGNVILEPIYDSLEEIIHKNKNYIYANKKGKYQIYDDTGTAIIPIWFDILTDFSPDKIFIEENGKKYTYDWNGNLVDQNLKR